MKILQRPVRIDQFHQAFLQVEPDLDHAALLVVEALPLNLAGTVTWGKNLKGHVGREIGFDRNLPFREPRTPNSEASGMRQFVDRMVNTPFEAKAIHSGLARQNRSRYPRRRTRKRSCLRFTGEMNSTSPSTHSHRCPSWPAARNSSQVIVVAARISLLASMVIMTYGVGVGEHGTRERVHRG